MADDLMLFTSLIVLVAMALLGLLMHRKSFTGEGDKKDHTLSHTNARNKEQQKRAPDSIRFDCEYDGVMEFRCLGQIQENVVFPETAESLIDAVLISRGTLEVPGLYLRIPTELSEKDIITFTKLLNGEFIQLHEAGEVLDEDLGGNPMWVHTIEVNGTEIELAGHLDLEVEEKFIRSTVGWALDGSNIEGEDIPHAFSLSSLSYDTEPSELPDQFTAILKSSSVARADHL